MLDIRIIAGRLTKDPEVKEIADGIKVARFTIAIDGDFKDKTGEKKTEFVDIEAWRQTADFASNYLKKGRMVCAVGRMKTDEWEDGKFVDSQGHPSIRKKGILTVDKIYPLDKPSGSDDASYETPEKTHVAQNQHPDNSAKSRAAAREAATAAKAAQAAQAAIDRQSANDNEPSPNGGSSNGTQVLPQW